MKTKLLADWTAPFVANTAPSVCPATPARTHSISRLKSRVLKLTFLSLKMMVKSGLEFILKLTEPLQSCCCPVQKNLPSRAELAWQVSRYLWRGSVNFKINSRPLFTIIFKTKNVNVKTRDFSPLIEWVLAGVCWVKGSFHDYLNRRLSSILVLITPGTLPTWETYAQRE